jgi:hypothetical protein
MKFWTQNQPLRASSGTSIPGKTETSIDSSLLPQVGELIKVFMFKVEPLAAK